jgi:hypothetical protein
MTHDLTTASDLLEARALEVECECGEPDCEKEFIAIWVAPAGRDEWMIVDVVQSVPPEVHFPGKEADQLDYVKLCCLLGDKWGEVEAYPQEIARAQRTAQQLIPPQLLLEFRTWTLDTFYERVADADEVIENADGDMRKISEALAQKKLELDAQDRRN